MDKRIILTIIVFNLAAVSLFAFNKYATKAVIINMSLNPKDIVNVGEPVAFSDKTEGASRWKWEFGDGESSYTSNGTHAYLDKGNFTVKLTLEGSFGVLTDSAKIIVHSVDTVKPQPIVAKPEPMPAPVAAQKVAPPPAPDHSAHKRKTPHNDKQLFPHDAAGNGGD